MQSNNFVKLSDMADLTVGYVGTMGKHYQKEGVLFLRSLNIVPFSLDLSDVKYISSSFNEQIKKSELKEGDVVIVRTGIPGTSTVIPKEMDGINCSDLVIVRPNKDKLNPYYLCSYINSWGRAQVKNAKVGAVQQHFNIGMAKNLLIPFPSKQIQDSISKLLSQINSKISLNNKIISELESMAKTIYDYWFLQFEFPNDEGKPYKSSGGKMVWNEKLKREIPEGWKVGKLIENVNFTQGYPFSSNNYSDTGNFKLYTIKNVQDGYIDTNVDNKITMIPENMDRNCLLKPGDIIMSLTGNVGRVAQVFENNALLNQRVLKISPLTFGESFLYLMLRSDYLQSRFKLLATGTSQKNLSPIDLGKEKIIVPSSIILSLFEKNTKALNREALKLKKENQELTSLRDFLLPLLMNGQVGFKEVTK